MWIRSLELVLHIGVGRFRILGVQGLEYWGAKGGANSQQAHDVVMTSMRRNDVASTSFRCHVPTRILINQCQIITFLILKSDIIENSRIELRGIVLPVPSNQIKVAFIIILPFNLYIFYFFPVSQKLKEKVGGLLGGGVPKSMFTPLSNAPPPSSYAYVAVNTCSSSSKSSLCKGSCILEKYIETLYFFNGTCIEYCFKY